MKYKKLYTIILLAVTSLVMAWVIPVLVRMATTTGQSYPFIYYSSILQDYVITDKSGTKLTYTDTKENRYSKEQFDSVTPLLSYRQLTMSGAMPDSILGFAVDTRLLNSKSVVWKYTPRDMHKPSLDMYVMYESMSGRVNLEVPEDVFRLKNNIEFINTETGETDREKSSTFRQALTDAGFGFPAKGVWGNPNPKKPYDEGYFILDNNGQLYHLKMVNGRPFVRDTKAGKEIDVAYFDMKEVPDKSIYGFLLDKEGFLYTVGCNGYKLTRFDVPPIDTDRDALMLMGNLFYWMLNITTDNGCTYHVLKAGVLEQHTAPYLVEAGVNRWNKVSEWMFPAYIQLSNKNSMYIAPTIVFNLGWAFLISGILAIIFTLTAGKRKSIYRKVADSILIVIFGIPALIASLIIK